MRLPKKALLPVALIAATGWMWDAKLDAQATSGTSGAGGNSSAGSTPTGSNTAAGNGDSSQGVAGQAERQATPGLEAGINNNRNQGPAQRSGAGFGGWNQNPWFFNPDVRDQLRLNNDQSDRFRNTYSRAWDQYQQSLSGLQGNLTDDQRLMRLRELGQNFQNDFTGSLNQFMEDPIQRQRFGQLMLQYQGYNAFHDPSVQQRLNLTDRQRENLDRLELEWNEQMQALSEDYPRERNARQRFNELRRTAGERIGNVLTDEQRQSWAEMLGEPFDFSPETYFPSDTNTPNQRSQPNR